MSVSTPENASEPGDIDSVDWSAVHEQIHRKRSMTLDEFSKHLDERRRAFYTPPEGG